MRGVNNGSVETVSAAAELIVAAENRAQQIDLPQRRKWISCILPCLGPNHQTRRIKINQAALVPEPSLTQTASTQSVNLPNPPPSSPASSLLQSEPASSNHSPASSMFSFGPYSIGPYSHETQLVSPPVFSTEPSTAPFTPPHLNFTTPSSPEVPFAQFLTSFDPNGSTSYQFQQISPNSVCSGNSSPYREGFNSNFPIRDTPKLIGPDGISARKSMPFHARKDGSLLDGQISAAVSTVDPVRRVSFEIDSEELEKKDGEQNGDVKEKVEEVCAEKSRPSVSRKGSKEFKFENAEGNNSGEPGVGADWWTSEKMAGKNGTIGTGEARKNWPFFPIEPGVS